RIQPATGDSIRRRFERFRTERDADVLRVYDGADDTAPLLGEFSGAVVPRDVFSSGRAAFLRCTTDGSGVGPGWSIHYTVDFTSRPGLAPWAAGLTLYPNPAQDAFRLRMDG